MSDTGISVLIAVFEADASICRAVQSVLMHPMAEAVLAPDDGRTYAWVKGLFPQRVTVLEPTYRKGPGHARNRAALHAKGQYFTMLDSDDRFAEQALHEALDCAHASQPKVAFLRTQYVHAESEELCRELPARSRISLEDFVNFHGSVHALYSRDKWRPYSDYRISQDVLHDAKLLIDSGGEAPLTRASYIQYLQTESITATTLQPEFNREYAQVLSKEQHPAIIHLFQEKLRVGDLYMQEVLKRPDLIFHEFVRDGLMSPPPVA